MLEKKLQLKNQANSVAEIVQSIRQGLPLAVFGVTQAFKCYLYSVIETPVLVVCKDTLTATEIYENLSAMTDKKVVVVPQKDQLLLPSRAYSKDFIYERITATYNLKSADVIIATPASLMQRFSDKVQNITLKKGEEYRLEQLVQTLVNMGYERVDAVEGKGSFSLRGDILDVFPINQNTPFRIDFFGDEIENVKSFDLETRQRKDVHDSVEILQAVEHVFSPVEMQKIKDYCKNLLQNATAETRENLRSLYSHVIDCIERSDSDGLNVFFSLTESAKNVYELLNEDTVVVFDEAKRVEQVANLFYTEFTERFESMMKQGSTFPLAVNSMLNLEQLIGGLNRFSFCAVQTLSTEIPFFNPLKIISPNVSSVTRYKLDYKQLYADLSNWVKSGYQTFIFTGDEKRVDKLLFDLSKEGVTAVNGDLNQTGAVTVYSARLLDGFIFHERKIVVVGSGNLYYEKREKRNQTARKGSYFSAPETGDYCVHETHGVGKVLGSKKITTTEGTKDYVAVEYYGGDILYVPVEQMDILTRYLGNEKIPRLSKIGGKDFERIKNSVKESIKKMSFDLKKLYEQRSAQKGFEFKADSQLQTVFADSFEYEETPDQITAIEEIYADMQSDKVMDRLVCGDVGFGKTEVAFRAVFLALLNGKQVALLAPTTILSEQHFNTAKERFKDFGVRIACLNRFKTKKEQAQVIQDLKDGKVDFIIGTHRLLSKDVKFADLGLLVLDEEQRFGVEHKEKIKLLKNNVDTLTLTATPIPRTLHLSLSGIRSISVINTPPKKRLPVQTYVTEQTDSLMKDAIVREINRGGQVFVLYNRVESIFNFASRLSATLPDLKFTVVHGQMEERTMEKNVLSFYRGETQVLVSTTIIENGIDLPRANTLIVIDADRLGLSTLYQLKGRVGRSDKLAYAYFTFSKEKILTNNAYDRLSAIVEFAEMGSGIKIAMRDLEIRGAGNVLGTEQHGHMEKIGYELYSKLLKEQLSGEEELQQNLDVRVSAFIPDGYIESNSAKMSAYKEIAETTEKTEKELREFLTETYGEIPEQTDNLINIAVVKRLAKEFKVSDITVIKNESSFIFSNKEIFLNEKFMRATDRFSGEVYFSFEETGIKLNFKRNGKTNREILLFMREFLEFANE